MSPRRLSSRSGRTGNSGLVAWSETSPQTAISARGRAKVVSTSPLRVACIGIGWWSDVLADAIQRSGKLEILGCYTRSEEKRKNFAAKYHCRPAASYEALLADTEIEAIINTTPNDMHLLTTRAAAAAGKHVFLDKPIANSVSDGRAITEACRKAGGGLALGYQRRRERHFRWVRRRVDDG